MYQIARIFDGFIGDFGPILNGRLVVDFDFIHSLQAKSLMVLFSILNPFDRNNVARSWLFRCAIFRCSFLK